MNALLQAIFSQSAPLGWAAIVALPLAVAALLPWRTTRAIAERLVPWCVLPAVLAAWLAEHRVVRVPGMLIASYLGLDQVGQVFLVLTAVLWLAAGWYAQGYLHDDPGRGRFFGFFLLAASGNLLLVVAQDALTFYLGFALMSFASYGLVVHSGDAEALRAGRIYIVLVVVGEILLFSGIVLRASEAPLQFGTALATSLPSGPWTTILLFAGLGIKAGIAPLHVWLPLAHPAAPTPASAVLSGAMIKAGLLGWLRLLPWSVAALEWSLLCVGLGLAAAFYGVLVGLTQSNPKTVLAYSSVSQMGLITVALGLTWAAPAAGLAATEFGLVVILVFALHHALAKGALFLGVGMAGGSHQNLLRRTLIGVGLALPALALIGAPATSGAIAKASLKALVDELSAGSHAQGLVAVLSWASVGTALLMGRFLWLTWPKAHAVGHHPNGTMAAAWTLVLAGVAVFPGLLDSLGLAAVVPLAMKPANLWAAAWPTGLGLGVAAAVAVVAGRRGLPDWLRLPAGDLVVPIEASLRRLPELTTGSIRAAAVRGHDRLTRGLSRAGRAIGGLAIALENQFSAWLFWGVVVTTLVVLLAAWGRL